MFKSPFKSPKYNVFNYKPRYYDPKKEHIEQIKRASEGTGHAENYKPGSIVRGSLKDSWTHSKRKTASKSANIRLLIIIVLLVGLIAYIFNLHTLF